MPRPKKVQPVEDSVITPTPSVDAVPEVAVQPAAKHEPVLIATKGRFSAFNCGDHFCIKNVMGQPIARVESLHDAEKMLWDMSRT